MKTAVEEIREAIQLAIEVTIAVGRPVAQTRAMAALASLDELEKQIADSAEESVRAYKAGMDDDRVKLAIAEAEERGRKAGYETAKSDSISILAREVNHAAPEAYTALKRALIMLSGIHHVGAAERAKEAAWSSAPIPHDHNAEVAAAGTCAACAAERAKGGSHG